jgi:hypothetical protein
MLVSSLARPPLHCAPCLTHAADPGMRLAIAAQIRTSIFEGVESMLAAKQHAAHLRLPSEEQALREGEKDLPTELRKRMQVFRAVDGSLREMGARAVHAAGVPLARPHPSVWAKGANPPGDWQARKVAEMKDAVGVIEGDVARCKSRRVKALASTLIPLSWPPAGVCPCGGLTVWWAWQETRDMAGGELHAVFGCDLPPTPRTIGSPCSIQ